MDKKRKKENKKTSVIMMVYLLLMLTLVVGTTLAILIDETVPVENAFTPSEVTSEVVETFNNNVKVKNTGDTEAYIRAKVVVTWKDSSGNIYREEPVEGVDYTIEWCNGKWLSGNDGFYYYQESIDPGKETDILFTNCQLMNGVTHPDEDGNFHLNVEILCSAIQGMPDTAVDVWDNAKVNVIGNSGTLSIENN